MNEIKNKGQVTIFIILAMLIVGGVIAYFSLSGNFGSGVPPEFEGVYDSYLSCLEDTASYGVGLLGEQGGYIELPAFEPGSAYMPFSSQLDFFGSGIPYWMYVSGNNLLREQIPTKTGMEEELGKYVGERIVDCDFTDFDEAGYDVYLQNGEVNVEIGKYDVSLDIESKLTLSFANNSVVLDSHSISVDSKLGKFFDLAMDVYNFEKSDMFLEKYALDVMRLYAPVTDTVITCEPQIFVEEDIRADIVGGLVDNIPTVKLSGDYFSLSSKDRDYFVTDPGFEIDENLNFLYSADWPTRIEMHGDKVIEPVGLQEGMGILGFCYVPYHFVYDINFPVLVQFYDDEEIFQFPVSVVISKNQAREALPTSLGESIESEVCKYRETPISVHTYDWDLNPVESRIQFNCLKSSCNIGETKDVGGDAVLEGEFPSCVNGFIVASAEGYASSKFQISTNEESIANIVLNKKYELSLNLEGVKQALVSFTSEDYSATVIYPDTDKIELIEGNYNVSVQAYDDTSLKFPAINERKCVDVPESGVGGFLGMEREKCYDVTIPETEVTFAVVGGGRTNDYVTEGQLQNAREININVPMFGLPSNLDELQKNYLRAEDELVYVSYE